MANPNPNPSQYPVSPPNYQAVGYTSKLGPAPPPEEVGRPLLTPPGSSRAGPSAGAYFDQPVVGDIPDDFKYGTNVMDSAPEIRNAFVRKVYTILFIQILATCLVAGGISQSPDAMQWVQQNAWSFYVPLFGTLINLGLLYWKRHSYPLNYVLLGTFTILEAFALGVMVSFFDVTVVLQALLITLGIFIGLTLFTFQSKYDFSGMGPWLLGLIIAFLMALVVQLFIPYSRTFDIVLAVGGTLLFSGFIIYDTYLIMSRLSPDEYILAAISLYLDFINLFINILRLIYNVQES